MSRFIRTQDYMALSVRDLLDARDAYHVHIANMPNVVGTAIGLYRIRNRDADANDPKRTTARKRAGARRLHDCRHRKHSVPCVLVFVDRWLRWEQLRAHPENMVPPRLYLPDGRVVLTCVIEARREEKAFPHLTDLRFAPGLIGGGYPVLSEVQGEERIGSIGCLVTDGHAVYALTNRHVAGPAGMKSYTVVSGQRKEIGATAAIATGPVEFEKAYPGLAGTRTFTNLDAGLIRVNELREWTAQVYGVGAIGDLLDVNVDTMSLGLIGTPVRAFGGASGDLQGEIVGLFYRYRSVGGFDYVADYLIGPRPGAKTVPTRPGDSGTLWFYDQAEDDVRNKKAAAEEGRKEDLRRLDLEERKRGQEEQRLLAAGKELPPPTLRPLALQWGAEALRSPDRSESMQFTLASGLATICRLLDVEVLRDWDVGHSETWGKVGHYKVGAKACELVGEQKLGKLLAANQTRIAVTDTDILAGRLPKARSNRFIPLADVPDLVWRSKRPKDSASHFADLDVVGAEHPFRRRSLVSLWRRDHSKLNRETWLAFYRSVGHTSVKKQGSLPFRVWEFYEEMVAAVKARSMTRFIAAAGIMAHYVGDACQPLHVSSLHHGREGHPEEKDVHAVYETRMLDRRRAELIQGLNKSLQGKKARARVQGGEGAAQHVMKLMAYTLRTLPPLQVIEAYNATAGRARIPLMWQQLGGRTIRCMAAGCLTLAELWQSAWLEGGGKRVGAGYLVRQDTTALRRLYNRKKWMEARWLRDMRVG